MTDVFLLRMNIDEVKNLCTAGKYLMPTKARKVDPNIITEDDMQRVAAEMETSNELTDQLQQARIALCMLVLVAAHKRTTGQDL